jgi:hypothetical protein
MTLLQFAVVCIGACAGFISARILFVFAFDDWDGFLDECGRRLDSDFWWQLIYLNRSLWVTLIKLVMVVVLPGAIVFLLTTTSLHRLFS